MKKSLGCIILVLLLFVVFRFASPTSSMAYQEVYTIILDSQETTTGTWTHSATIDGSVVSEYDYVWHIDPNEIHDQVKNSPAEYYTGTKPEEDDAVYIAHDIFYYPQLPAENFVKINYDGSQEWAYYYTASDYQNYIFATLPVSGDHVPSDMMHTATEAYENAVLHITKAGTYALEGSWHGQIWIDLGDQGDTFTDPAAKVTIILNGVDVTCTVAPALIFYSVYECDNEWEMRDIYTASTDTSNAGANVIIADSTENNFTGTNIYRMLKAQYKDKNQQNGVKIQSKMRKIDGAFYSYVSMNMDGEETGTGVLNINSGFEGLDTELHLTINGGHINIFSQDDGINVNEDGVSVVTFNGGTVHILAGLGNEGDGVDSNGFLVINGGTVISLANPRADSGLDSDCGSYVNGGNVVALGSTMDWAEANDTDKSGQVTMNLQFLQAQSSDEAIIITDLNGKVVFAYDPDKDEVAGALVRGYRGAILSSPALEKGKGYYVYVGGDVLGSESAGVYDITTVTDFSNDAKQQCYTGTWKNSGKGGGPNGQRPPEPPGGFGGQQPPEPPGGFDGQRPPEPPGEFDGQQPPEPPGGFGGQRPPEPPGGFDGQQPPEPPGGFGGQRPPEPPGGFDGQQPPEPPGGFDGQQPPEPPDGFGDQGVPTGDASVLFMMEDKVNNFSQVSDSVTVYFIDVKGDDWFSDAIQWVTTEGLMQGVSGTLFEPNVPVSMNAVVQALFHIENELAASGADSLDDALAGTSYEVAITWAMDNGIVTSVDRDLPDPNSTVTREYLVVILYRYAQYKKYDVSEGTSLLNYQDVSSVDPDAFPMMDWACNAGILQGNNNALMPKDNVTRAQTAVILQRFHGLIH